MNELNQLNFNEIANLIKHSRETTATEKLLQQKLRKLEI